MDAILNILTTIFNLTLVMVGFGLIVFIHELGHFAAAKWARVRVLAFALGFGSALVSFRKGMGWRRGSSERDYLEILRSEPTRAAGISPTEYRLNYLPLGGYVKMLGQEDLDPTATSSAPDSYGMCHPLKRMVIISAGVVMNILLAGLLFMIVFLVGLDRQPPRIGALTPGGAASGLVAVNADGLDPRDAVLQPGDLVVAIDGSRPSTFDDLILSAAMGTPTTPVRIGVERAGVDRRLDFDVLPKPGMFDGLLDFGIEPYRSNRVLNLASARQRAEFAGALERVGLAGLEPGSELVRAAGQPVESAHDLDRIVRGSGGLTVPLVFRAPEGGERVIEIQPVAELQHELVPGAGATMFEVEHLLGLSPVMMVEEAAEDGRGYAQGLRTGDVFERVGSVEFPSLQQGIAEIKAHRGRQIDVVVRRPAGRPGDPDADQPPGAYERVTLSAGVTRDGLIGFVPGTVADRDTLVGMPPAETIALRPGAEPRRTAASRVVTRPGTRVVMVGESAVGSFTELREAMRAQTTEAIEAGRGETLRLTVERLMADATTDRESVEWTLTPTEVGALHELSWTPRFSLALFEMETFRLKAAGPVDALWTGVGETNRVMMSTYLTLLRLFQGTVRVEHLKGPVGITHMGTLIAERGVVWLMFFFALVSVNLAVINFLPLPIVDGGQFLMLIYEWIRGRPVPVGLQNALTLAGLLLIGSVFVIVTFNDVAKLLGG